LTFCSFDAIIGLSKEKEKKTMKKLDKRMFKKEGEELQQYLAFRRKGSVVPAKKGKGSYNRKKAKKVDYCY
jgi:hypothetical protein